MDLITSSSNNRVKWLKLLLEKSAERKAASLLAVEGYKEIVLALANGFELVNFCCSPEEKRWQDLQIPERLVIKIQSNVLDKIVLREGPDSMLAVFKSRQWKLDDFIHDSCIIIVDGVEKPGNIGAIARTVAAMGLRSLLVTNPVSDLYNPHAIRSSVGALFALKIGQFSVKDILTWSQQHAFSVFITHLNGAKAPWEFNFPDKSIIVLGSEASGVDAAWENNAHQRIKIPMTGAMDSLNVANTAAMVIYEWTRQRQCTRK